MLGWSWLPVATVMLAVGIPLLAVAIIRERRAAPSENGDRSQLGRVLLRVGGALTVAGILGLGTALFGWEIPSRWGRD